MFLKNGNVLFNRFGTAALTLITVLSFALPASSADSAEPALKAITPQLDPEAEKKPAVRKPLQAGLQHTEKLDSPKGKALRGGTDERAPLRAGARDGGFFGKARGGAKTAQQDTLKSKANAGGFNVAATSGFGIIGVKFVLQLGKPPIINRVFAGTPAHELGLQQNDAIVAVDGVPTYGLTKEEVYDLIIGSPGTKVNISIMRAGDFHVYTCTRMDINDLTDPVVRKDYLTSM